MATVRVPETGQLWQNPAEIRSFLAPFGIYFEQWPVEGRIQGEATSDEILAAYAPEVEALKERGGYITADVINVTPDVPGLQAMLDRFNKEHTHAEDEVRFIVKGRGVFHIHPSSAPVCSIEVEAGDLINVPAGSEHWFDLCNDRTIRAIRLFREKAGWTPVYTGNTIAERFQPLCFGPQYIPAQPRIETLPAFAA